MDYTQLGNSGLSVSKYALGSIPFTGTNGFENAGGMSQDMTNHMIDYACIKVSISLILRICILKVIPRLH